MDFELWHGLLVETVPWQNISEEMSYDILQRTIVAWYQDEKYFLQSGSDRVDLTKLYEQYKLLATLKGTSYEKEIPWGG